jgi:hypothetical protein
MLHRLLTSQTMNQQTTPSSQRRQNDQNGHVKAWKLASNMNVIETKKQESDHKHGMIVCKRHEKDEKKQPRVVIECYVDGMQIKLGL